MIFHHVVQLVILEFTGIFFNLIVCTIALYCAIIEWIYFTMMWNQWFMNVQAYSCPTIVLLKEKVFFKLDLQVDDGIFKKFPYLPTNRAGSRDAIASKKSITINVDF